MTKIKKRIKFTPIIVLLSSLASVLALASAGYGLYSQQKRIEKLERILLDDKEEASPTPSPSPSVEPSPPPSPIPTPTPQIIYLEPDNSSKIAKIDERIAEINAEIDEVRKKLDENPYSQHWQARLRDLQFQLGELQTERKLLE